MTPRPLEWHDRWQRRTMRMYAVSLTLSGVGLVIGLIVSKPVGLAMTITGTVLAALTLAICTYAMGRF